MDILEKIYDSCDEISKEFDKEIKSLANRLANSLESKLRSNNIVTHEFDPERPTVYTDSKAKLMASDRILSLILGSLEFEFLFANISNILPTSDTSIK